MAAPAALLGAIIGEYLGAQQGLGAAMIQAQSSFAVARTWSIALVIAALAGSLYLGATLLAHVLTPWARQVEIGLGGLAERCPTRRAMAPASPARSCSWRRLSDC